MLGLALPKRIAMHLQHLAGLLLVNLFNAQRLVHMFVDDLKQCFGTFLAHSMKVANASWKYLVVKKDHGEKHVSLTVSSPLLWKKPDEPVLHWFVIGSVAEPNVNMLIGQKSYKSKQKLLIRVDFFPSKNTGFFMPLDFKPSSKS